MRSVKLYNNGDFRSSAADMEQALAEYYRAYEDCLAGCEGAYELQEFKDFYPAIAGDWAGGWGLPGSWWGAGGRGVHCLMPPPRPLCERAAVQGGL